VVLVLRAAHGHTSPGEVVEAISLLRRAQRQVSGATTSAGSFATASTTADRLLWLENYAEAARVTKQGDHAALMDHDGLYAELFSLQAEGYLGR
jgi:hypothetical protein